jgi:hypothetical protein
MEVISESEANRSVVRAQVSGAIRVRLIGEHLDPWRWSIKNKLHTLQFTFNITQINRLTGSVKRAYALFADPFRNPELHVTTLFELRDRES